MRRLGVFWSAGLMLASVVSAVVGIAPASATTSFGDWVTVSAGGEHTCGVRANGKLYCWGSDANGQVGDGFLNWDAVTTQTRVGTFEDWATVSAGNEHTCGIRRNGKLYCWGRDQNFQVGDGGSNETAIGSPKRIGAFEDWARVSAGQVHTCGVRRNGKLYCWGDDQFGELGNGVDELGYAATPTRIGGFEDWATVAAGLQQTCGVRRNGKLYCWGSDGNGQLGNGAAGATLVPNRIGSLEDWVGVSAGQYHTCGVRKNGKLYCWGNPNDGKLGIGEVYEDQPAPVRVGAFEDWASVEAGDDHTCGVRRNGKLYCWGSNFESQIGNGGSHDIDVIRPARIGTFEDWSQAAAGGDHSCAVRRNGKLYCWGYEAFGEIGDGENPVAATTPRRI